MTEARGDQGPSGRAFPKLTMASVLVLGVAIAAVVVGTVFGAFDSPSSSFARDCQRLDGQEGCITLDRKETEIPDSRILVWAEEFDVLDPAIWSVEHSTYGDGNNELQCYTPDQVSVEAGSLVLRAENVSVQCPNGSLRQQTSGMVRTRVLTLSPGQYIEWRVKLTPADDENQAGLWPAVWSSSWAEGGWPTGGEWDGFEVMTANSPDRVSFGIHYSDASGANGKKSREVFGERFSDDWHEFRFDYGLDGVLVWYMDGVETHRVTEAPTQQGYPAPFDQTMTELRINLALGGNPGPLNPAALPATLKVDYIRAYLL